MSISEASYRLLLVAIAVALPTSVIAAPPPSAEQSLSRLSVDLMNAIERKDTRTLDSLLAKDFSLRMPGERKTTPRAEWMANAVSMDWSDFRYENLVVRVNGQTATVSSRLYFRVAPMPFALDSGIVDSWERRDGRWQITARYLGESRVQQRIAFALGLLAASTLAGIGAATLVLVRRRRRRTQR